MSRCLIFSENPTASSADELKLSDQIGNSLSLRTAVELTDREQLDSYFSVSELAASSIAAVGSSIADFLCDIGICTRAPRVQVSQRLASHWFHQSIYPIDWVLPPVWDALAGDYRTRDGWIKLHTNLAHHRQAVIKVLDVMPDRDQVTREILTWKSSELELSIISEGGVAAMLNSRQDWQQHPQGIAIASEPLITWGEARPVLPRYSPSSRQRPLEGLRVLDITRVLAGPVATRTLASLGADVLRIDPPGWDEPFVVPDISIGKRCATLELTRREDRKIFENLLKNADVLVHGYRPGALEGLGYDQSVRQDLAVGLIEVSLDAYGWSGPWAHRRGFDSLVQMSSGVAHAGMLWAGVEQPTPLPVQALDHATGYLMAAAVIRLLGKALNGDGVGDARLSLARTSQLLAAYPQGDTGYLNRAAKSADFAELVERTPWGNANRLRQALKVEGSSLGWNRSASKLGTSAARWLTP